MNCLIDYIGLKVCASDSLPTINDEPNPNYPESGLFINSLPGITLESVDRIATEDQITFRQVWLDVQNEAWVQFEIDFLDELTKCFAISPYCDYTALICDNDANKRKLTNAWRYLLGNQLMQFRLYSTRLNRFTLVDAKQAEQLRDYYDDEYRKSLTQAVKLIDATACCMDCGGNPEIVVWLP